MENINSISFQVLRQRMVRELSKSLLRVTLKKAAEYQIRKQNTALGKSPTRRMRTQSNHFFASIYAYFKLECLAVSDGMNQFAFKSKLYLSALKASFNELQQLQTSLAA